jgi:hypothetical protein
MGSYVPANLRRLVTDRAAGLCEYCLIHQDDTFLGCQIEHIIAQKHGGATVPENLALACAFCNRAKGTDIATILPPESRLSRLLNPRTDLWHEHLRLAGLRIEPLTDIGRATVSLLNINHPDRLLERETLIDTGRYPSEAARRLIHPS